MRLPGSQRPSQDDGQLSAADGLVVLEVLRAREERNPLPAFRVRFDVEEWRAGVLVTLDQEDRGEPHRRHRVVGSSASPVDDGAKDATRSVDEPSGDPEVVRVEDGCAFTDLEHGGQTMKELFRQFQPLVFLDARMARGDAGDGHAAGSDHAALRSTE